MSSLHIKILRFHVLKVTKTGSGGTDNVWLYDMKADGYSLDDNKYKEVVYEKVEYEPTETIIGKIDELEKEIQQNMTELKKLLGV